MSNVAAIRAAILAKMQAVANIGQVHDYERHAKQMNQLKTLYSYQGQLRGWYIRRLATTERMLAVGRHADIIRWRIVGFMALDDGNASEKTFDTLIEAVRAAFRADPGLNGTVDTVNAGETFGMQLEDHGPVMFADVLCHSARLSLTTLNKYAP